MSQMLQHTSNKAYAQDVNNWLATNMWPAHRDARVNDDTDPDTKTDAGILLLQEADPSSNVHKYLCGKGLFEFLGTYNKENNCIINASITLHVPFFGRISLVQNMTRTLDPPPRVQFSVGPIHGFVELGIFHPRDDPWYDGNQVALKYYVSLPYVQLDANVPLFPVDGANTPKIKALYQTSPPMALLVQSLREVSNTPATYPAGFLRLFNQRGAKHVQQFPETSNTFSVRQALLLYGQNTANPVLVLERFLNNFAHKQGIIIPATPKDKGLKSKIINIAAKPQRQTIRAYFGQLFHIVGTISLDSFLLNAILSIYIPTIGVQRTCQVAGDLTNVAGVVVTLDDPLINGLLNFDLNDMGKDLQQTDTPTPLPAPTPAPAPSPGPKPEPKITPRTSRKGDQGSGLPKGGRMKKPAPMAPQLLVPSTPPLRSAEDFLSPANDGQANTDDELEPEDE
ncbi:hypothetical protein RHS04_06593 [Rhizoctonia solani]|uniref:Uncharacterized protein n=1 Tax=Rhizoctonia solani TaxID=456999 RepID=A0A8H7LL59_9AGAM|nr:hypothetical protein RHS04_06593 [Rhizoctonia solani]